VIPVINLPELYSRRFTILDEVKGRAFYFSIIAVSFTCFFPPQKNTLLPSDIFHVISSLLLFVAFIMYTRKEAIDSGGQASVITFFNVLLSRNRNS